MSPALKTFGQRWLINTLGVLVAAHIVAGIRYDSAAGLFVASLTLGILNAFIRPVMLLLSLPLLVFTLGLFTLVINAVLLFLVGLLVTPFHVDSFRSAFWGALVISIVSFVASVLTGTGKARVEFRRSRSRQPPPRQGPGSGPVIDV